MADVGVSLGIDAKELYQELQNVTHKFGQFASETTQAGEKAGHGFTGGLHRALGGIQGFFGNIKSIATSALGAIGIGLGAGAVIGETKSVIEFGAHIEDLSRKFGVSADVLSRWGFAAQKTGTDVDALAKFIGFLEVNREKAAKGGDKQIADFKALGVSAVELRDPLLSVNEILAKISKGSLDPASLKAVGGKGALDVRTLLAQVGEGGIDLDKSLKSSDTAKLKEIEDSFINLKQVLTVQLAPAIATVFDFISTHAKSVGGHIEAIVTRVREAGIQLVALNEAAKSKTPEQFFAALKHGRDETEYLEKQLAPKLLDNPDPDQKSVDEAKASAAKPKRAFGLLAGGEEDIADAKQEKKDEKEKKKADAALAKEEKKEERDEAKSEKEHERDLKDELRARGLLGGGRGRGSGRGGGRGPAVDQDKLLEDQDHLDKALARDEADRRAHGSFTGPGGGAHSGLVSGHVQSSGGLKTGSLSEALSDKDFHDQFKPKGLGLGSSDDFHKQFQPIGLSRSDEVKRAQVGKEGAQDEKHLPVAEKQLTTLEKIEKNTQDLGKNKS